MSMSQPMIYPPTLRLYARGRLAPARSPESNGAIEKRDGAVIKRCPPESLVTDHRPESRLNVNSLPCSCSASVSNSRRPNRSATRRRL